MNTSPHVPRPREPLMQSTSTHLVISHRAITAIVTALAVTGLALASFGIWEAYTRLPAEGDTVVSIALGVAAITVTIAVYVALVLIPRRARRTPFSA